MKKLHWRNGPNPKSRTIAESRDRDDDGGDDERNAVVVAAAAAVVVGDDAVSLQPTK